MARGKRVRRKLLQTRPSTARERLLAAEAHIAELVAEQRSLEDTLRSTHRLVEDTLAQQTTQLNQQLEALAAQAREDYRKQVGVLDVVRRQQKRQDEDFERRLTATEATLAGAAENSRERLAALELHTHTVEELARSAEQRAALSEGVRAELAVLAARLEDALQTVRVAVEALSARTDAIEGGVRIVTDEMAALSGQVTATIGMLAPLGDVPSRLERFAEDLSRFSDRLTATELVVHQASDLEMQLERAEEFERLMAEVDPATYATKTDLERLRADLGPQGEA